MRNWRRTNKTSAPQSSRIFGRCYVATKKRVQEQDMREEGSKSKEAMEQMKYLNSTQKCAVHYNRVSIQECRHFKCKHLLNMTSENKKNLTRVINIKLLFKVHWLHSTGNSAIALYYHVQTNVPWVTESVVSDIFKTNCRNGDTLMDTICS
jgi:hypothetical protein